MAFDGMTVACIVVELNQKLINGRLSKIAQPEQDELLITIKTKEGAYLLSISANPSLPMVCITKKNKENPQTAPNFCMLLRKHIGNGKITAITQPSLERIIDFEVEHFNEMGDLVTSHLMVELMGKHSNIILCDNEMHIIDSIKRIPASLSSVREVLPGRDYFIPFSEQKADPFSLTREQIITQILTGTYDCSKSLYTKITGFSPFAAEELLHVCEIDSSKVSDELTDFEKEHIANQLLLLIEDISQGHFSPKIVLVNEDPVDYAVTDITHIPGGVCSDPYDSISDLLNEFYAEKEMRARIRQKSVDIRKLVQNHLERAMKKYDLQEKQLKDTAKRDRYKLYGDLLSTYGHSLKPNQKECSVLNYYDNTDITIPLDETLTPLENAKRYYEKYAKLKRTAEATEAQLIETGEEIDYLSSVRAALELSTDAANLNEIKEELIEAGYAKRVLKNTSKGKKGPKKLALSEPYHYLSSDGYHIYVGKNNLQNDHLTFDFANGNDLWFHAKKMPGSHVIVKIDHTPIPDRLYEEAAALAAYYSSNRAAQKTEVDYIEKKFIKKPPKAKPGYVIYHTNYSLIAKPEIAHLKLLS